MKKLMIAAAVAALVSGVYAGCNEPGGDDGCACELSDAVYSWQFKGKTGTGVLVKLSNAERGTSGGSCAEGTPGGDAEYEVVRVPGALAITAYTYLCDFECSDFASKLANPTKAQFYMTKPLVSLVAPYKGVNFVNGIDVAHVIGKSKTQYELAGTATFDFGTQSGQDVMQKYDLTFAGFGSFDTRNHRVTTVSGNFAGTQRIPRYNGKIGDERCPGAGYWECCCLTFVEGSTGDSDMNRSVAYGTWSVKYNAAATARLQANKAYWVKN